jgi:hypothetical protein
MNRSTLHPLPIVLMLVVVCPARAAAQTVVVHGRNDDRPNRAIDMTFTKWINTFPLMEGYWGATSPTNSSARFSNDKSATAGRQLLPACAKLRPHHSARGAV